MQIEGRECTTTRDVETVTLDNGTPEEIAGIVDRHVRFLAASELSPTWPFGEVESALASLGRTNAHYAAFALTAFVRGDGGEASREAMANLFTLAQIFGHPSQFEDGSDLPHCLMLAAWNRLGRPEVIAG